MAFTFRFIFFRLSTSRIWFPQHIFLGNLSVISPKSYLQPWDLANGPILGGHHVPIWTPSPYVSTLNTRSVTNNNLKQNTMSGFISTLLHTLVFYFIPILQTNSVRFSIPTTIISNKCFYKYILGNPGYFHPLDFCHQIIYGSFQNIISHNCFQKLRWKPFLYVIIYYYSCGGSNQLVHSTTRKKIL